MTDIKDFVVIVLSSTVLSGVITSVVSFIVNGRNNRLKYITEERRIWRGEMREIVDEIYTIKFPNQIKNVLAKLKVRINPYGKDMKEDYLHDSHIWELVTKIESNPYKEFEENRNRLVIYISLLLKFDWDRAKEEVIGNVEKVILFITFGYGMCFLIYNHFFRCKYEFNQLFLVAVTLFYFYQRL